MRMTRPELITLAHTCADWAPNYYGGPLALDREQTVRHIADGHLHGLALKYGRPAVWDAVAAHLDANPHLLTAPRTTQAERDKRQTERDAHADRYLKAAYRHYVAAEPYEALALIDRAELASPTFKDYDQFRTATHTKTPPFTPTDLTGTAPRRRVTLPLATPIPGPPVMYHGSETRDWVYPGRTVVEGDWPAAIPEHCTATDSDTQTLASGLAIVCTGCGLDCT
ncbi:hypothetical protein ACIBSS_29060 [Micromonospora aurantiaca]|uniref:hypothetical protein n=2 Tax=Micromonospora aurantiaca (nom. illeg.) TaxID=47850 RepID=UPI0026A6D329